MTDIDPPRNARTSTAVRTSTSSYPTDHPTDHPTEQDTDPRDPRGLRGQNGGRDGDEPQRLPAKCSLLDDSPAQPEPTPSSLSEVAALAVAAVGAASHAAVSVHHQGTLRVEAATDPVARRFEMLQRRLEQGPSLDVLLEGRSHSVLSAAPDEPPRPDTGVLSCEATTDLQRHARDLGVGAVLSLRIATGLSDTQAALTVSAPAGCTFSEGDVAEARRIARDARGAVAAHQVTHLTRALETSRDLGVAIGILMSRYRIPREEASSLLKRASQDRNRKANVLALQIIDIGELPDTRAGPPAPPTRRTCQRPP